MNIVTFSGGLASAATLKLVHDMDPNTIAVFCDTSMEDEDLYRFNDEVIAAIGCELVTLKDGRTPWQVYDDVDFIGNTRIDPCSRILKREPFQKWLSENHSPENCTLWTGLDWTEIHRFEKLEKRNKPWVYRSILIERKLSKNDARRIIEGMGIRQPTLYDVGMAHNNCNAFCCKAGQGHYATLWQNSPERYQWHEEQEQELIARKPNLKPFLRKTINGQIEYLTLKEFRERFLETNCTIDMFSVGGCGCFTDD